MVVIGVVIGLVLGFLIVCSSILRCSEVSYRKKGLPPGTMGWPLIGETTEFLKQGPVFLKNQRARYGNIFKSHILGCPTVICMDPKLSKFIMMNEGKGLVPGYPQSMLDILGKWNIAAIHGSQHKVMRSALHGLVHTGMIKDKLITKIDDFMKSYVSNWNDKVIDIQEKTKELWLHSALKQIASIEPGPFSDELKSEIMNLVLGTLSLPINFPGSNYRRGMQARKKIVRMLQKLIDERRQLQNSENDMLDTLLQPHDKYHRQLTDEQIVDLIITLVYSGSETVSTTMMMAIKYLSNNPKVLQELRNEHINIMKRKLQGEAIDWNDYKSMTFTHAVIFETVRLATVVNGVLRRTTQDMKIEGFYIPKGWKIYVYTRETNYDPLIYPEPLKFNPWRWQDNNLESHHNFMAFGGGGRLCPGKELGIVEIAIFLHYFVTRWEEVGEDKLLKFPRVEAPNGLHVRIQNY